MPRQTPIAPPEQTLEQGFARHLADDEPLRPAERLQCPEFTDSLRDRREGEQARNQEGGEQSDYCKRGSEFGRQVLASTSVPETRFARSAAVVTEAPSTVSLDLGRDCSHVVGAFGPHIDRVHAALAIGELLQLRELHVHIRGLAAERRLCDPDHGERLAAELDGVTDREPVTRGVALVEDRLARGARSEVVPLDDLSGGDSAECLLRLIDSGDAERGRVDVPRRATAAGARPAELARLLLLLGHSAFDVKRVERQTAGSALDRHRSSRSSRHQWPASRAAPSRRRCRARTARRGCPDSGARSARRRSLSAAAPARCPTVPRKARCPMDRSVLTRTCPCRHRYVVRGFRLRFVDRESR